MKGAPIRYGTRFGCRFGQPHDMVQIADTKTLKVEKCRLCNKTFRWPKGYRERVDNVEYLHAHVRNYAQPNGSTRRVYNKLYRPEKAVIHITV